QRSFEGVIMALLAIITIGFVAGMFVSPVDWPAAAGGLLPRFDGPETVLLAASMLGATVMPHAIYLHSSLARDRHGASNDAGRVRRLVRASRWDVVIALVLAGAVNIAMLLLAAANLHGGTGSVDTSTIEGAHAAITTSLGPVIGAAFAVGLLASGLASTSVGSYAGAIIMSGLLKVRIPLLVRRVVTLIPALIILAIGIEPTWALVLSQVFLSLGIPFAVIPLIRLTGDARVMGVHVDAWWTRVAAWVSAGLIVVLNVALVVLLVIR
ncbi:MAG: Nramp family divalent metal transporter, partial [Microbacteriaceae bacterium]